MRGIFLKYYCFCLLFLCAVAQASSSNVQRITVARLFSDNMVVQQGIPVPVWGTASPGENIRISMAGKTVYTISGPDGKWIGRLPLMPYGGPYVMHIKGKDAELTINNVMVGEVWLASGQSNMGFNVGRSVLSNNKNPATTANYPMIREFSVPMQVSKTPLSDLQSGKWQLCNAKNVVDFSAVAYFFARELYLKKKVAIGIIHSSWGGTPIEAWTSSDKLKTHPDFQGIDSLLHSPDDWVKLQAKSEHVDSMRNQVIATANEGLKQGANLFDYPDGNWQKATYPIKTSGIKAPQYSFTWFRKVLDIPQTALGKDLKLSLGKVIESNITYFNGVEVGRSSNEQTSYIIPKGLVRPGKNIVAIRLLSQWGNGQIGNSTDEPMLRNTDGTFSLSLKGEWRYNFTIEPKLIKVADYQNMPSVLFNAMINPLIPYGIKGVIWYQGETNSGRYLQYRSLQPLLFTDWRNRWKLGDFPFLFVQLPALIETSWQWMREAQAASLTYHNTGMATTIDVGDPYDLHPRNKEPVGKRLALLAQKIAYGESVVSTGPSYKTSYIRGNTFHIRFNNSGRGLTSNNNAPLSSFLIAGEDRVFYKAEARISGEEVIVYSLKVSRPVAIRYAWEPIPKVNFYNKEGLPAVPFRTDDWSK